MRVESYYFNGYRVLNVDEDIERGSDVRELRERVTEILEQGIDRLAIGFTADSTFDTEVISVLVEAYKRLSKRKGALAVVEPEASVLSSLRILGLTDLIEIYAAVEQLGGPPMKVR